MNRASGDLSLGRMIKQILKKLDEILEKLNSSGVDNE